LSKFLKFLFDYYCNIFLIYVDPSALSDSLTRLLTYVFINGNIAHIVFNVLALVYLGGFAERSIGTPRYIIVYIISGIIAALFHGIIASYILHNGSVLLVGVSGTISCVSGITNISTHRDLHVGKRILEMKKHNILCRDRIKLMKFVQISDLHIGGLFKEDAFNTIVDEVNNDLKPDVIIISGDLTDEGLIFQFQKAHAEINRFNCPNLIIFPGNHDYRHTGYLLFKKFFPSSRQIYEFDDDIIVLALGTARPDRDEGEVGHRQNVWMEEILGKSDKKIKIVAMHHHLIAIPDTGYTNLVGILDAGDTLRACLESKVDLVLCGHKHRPWIWNLGTLKIAYAGTACSWRYRGVFEDTYNIIDIKGDKIDVDIKIVGGRRMPLTEVVNRYEPEERKEVLSK
jgi:3',5'-cyclic-AMP phosphodiesterase